MKRDAIFPRMALLAGALALAGVPAAADEVGDVHEPAAEHIDQSVLFDLVVAGEHDEAFELAFEVGDELFETEFNVLDGVGANVGQGGQKFSRVPRADLAGPGEWANHFPERATGPNAQACNHCHDLPFDDGAGTTAGNVHRDPTHSASMGSFIIRNTPHLFAPGALQVLAEEMTERLHRIRDRASNRACETHGPVTRSLFAKGVSFGSIKATPVSFHPCEVELDLSQVVGVGDDLIVRPFQWKGNFVTLRDFNRGAGHNELGMQAVEITGDGADGDFDGVADELTIGDLTALTVYLAAQPRPTSKVELAILGLIDPLPAHELAAIGRGGLRFLQIGCASCHRPILGIDDPVFNEPSENPNYRDDPFPAGQDPVARKVDPAFPVSFDLTEDQPDNVIELPGGGVFRLGSLRKNGHGGGLVELYGDLKLHDMGPALAETIDETGTGASVWITKELWGVGSTAPYLHDGRASTLTEAILAHGGDAQNSRNAFAALDIGARKDLVAFLDNLVLFKQEEEE